MSHDPEDRKTPEPRADAVASEPYKAATEKLNATARFLSGKDFRKMFDDDSVANAEAVKKAGIK